MLRDAMRRWAAYQRTMRELSALNDKGISRKDISKIARDHANHIRGANG